MDEAKWTKGPWLADGINVFSHGSCLAICDDEVFPQEEYEANARLIAAAPDLFAALSAVSDMLMARPDIVAKLQPLMGPAENAVFEQASAALAKAKDAGHD